MTHHFLTTPLISTTPTTSAATSKGRPISSTISFISNTKLRWLKRDKRADPAAMGAT